MSKENFDLVIQPIPKDSSSAERILLNADRIGEDLAKAFPDTTIHRAQDGQKNTIGYFFNLICTFNDASALKEYIDDALDKGCGCVNPHRMSDQKVEVHIGFTEGHLIKKRYPATFPEDAVLSKVVSP